VPTASPASLLQEARAAFAAGDYDRALAQARAALDLTRTQAPGPHGMEFLCRNLMARSLEARGDAREALALHWENARRGSDQEDTYQRLAALGERLGDAEAVRVGCQWLQSVAAQFGLVDLRAKQRQERVERRLSQGRFGPAHVESDAAERPPQAATTGSSCLVVLAACIALCLAAWFVNG